MPIITPPTRTFVPDTARVVFLAGSIEMGQAAQWQAEIAQTLLSADPSLIVANPRRPSWDASWTQSIDNPMFCAQVSWELDHLERADLVVLYLQPGTQSPISLLELGKHLARPDAAQSTLICCPDGFWRKGNVDIIAQRAGLPPPLTSLDDLKKACAQWGAR